MFVLGVDFAPRFSAAALMDEDGTLISYRPWDVGPESMGFDHHLQRLVEFQHTIIETDLTFDGIDPNDVIPVVEDVTHFMTKPAQVLRLQGAFRTMLWLNEFSTPVMVLPKIWQNFFGWHKTEGTTSKGFAKFCCDALGYTFSGTKGKSTVDVRDAVLIARWYVEQQKAMKEAIDEVDKVF